MSYGELPAGFKVNRGFAKTSMGQMHYREAGNGPDLVLLHNTWLSSKMYSGVIPTLAEHFHVVAFDTIGQGDSDPAPDKQMEIEDLAQALLEAIAELGLQRPAVVGHHTGSVIASEASIQQPASISRLVISGMPFWRNPDRRLENEHDDYFQGWEPVEDGSHLIKMWNEHSGIKRSGMESSVAVFGDYIKPGPRTSIALQALFRWNSNEKLQQITVPTLVVCHDSDGFIRNIHHVYEAIPGAKYEELKGGDPHPLHGEASFADAVIRFCRSES